MLDIAAVLKANLIPEQAAAAVDTSKEILTLACAGSGKSRTLAFRIARLIAEGAEARSIVAFTFTNKAAESLKLRVATALNDAGLDSLQIGAMFIGTIDSYCGAVLGDMDPRYRQYEQLDSNRFALYLLSRYYDLGLQNVQNDPARARANNQPQGMFDTIKHVANAWITINNEARLIQDVLTADAILGTVLQNLAVLLEKEEYMDFSQTIRLVSNALVKRDSRILAVIEPLKHLMVDEYQDVNPIQELLIKELHDLSDTLFVVGDDDQAIYAWRGADVNNILGFKTRYPNSSEHTLSVNFRSTEPIVRVADQFAHQVLGPTRTVKNPKAFKTEAPRDFRKLWFNTRQEEAAWVVEKIKTLLGTAYRENDQTVRGLTPADFAILMRSTGQSELDGSPRHAAYTQLLTANGIVYSLESGGSVFDRPQVSVLRSAFGLLRNGTPDRPSASAFFQNSILPSYPNADFDGFTKVLQRWGSAIHLPVTGARRRVYPQQLVHDFLSVFGISTTPLDDGTMADIGVFSRIIQDVETVYRSIDTKTRFTQVLNFLQNAAEAGYESATDDILRRPDAITVSTVHKVKGLEFPVVFVVDVEAQRFPNKRHRYDGWLPISVIGPALARGAYQSDEAGEARLFFTALTRAERFLYITGCCHLPGGNSQRKESPFAQRLNHSEISSDVFGDPSGLVPAIQKRRIADDVVPTSYSDIRYYLRCPYEYKLRKVFGFSPHIGEMFGFGKTVHTALGKLHQTFQLEQGLAPTPLQAEAIAADVFHLKHVYPSKNAQSPGPYERARDAAAKILGNYARDYSNDFHQRRELEQRFEIPVPGAVITGAIDLMLHEDVNGKILDASVVDFKSIEATDDPESNEDLEWTELALQVQLYAKAAADVLGETAKTGNVHFLKDGVRVLVPIHNDALLAAVNNVSWSVERILAEDFPMRPNKNIRGKCEKCDFKTMCPKLHQQFKTSTRPLPIHVPPSGTKMARIFSDYDGDLKILSQ